MRSGVVERVRVGVRCWWEADGRGKEGSVDGVGGGGEGGNREGGRKSVKSRRVERVFGWTPGEAFELDELVCFVDVGAESGVVGGIAWVVVLMLAVEGRRFGVKDGETGGGDEEVGEGEGVAVLFVVVGSRSELGGKLGRIERHW